MQVKGGWQDDGRHHIFLYGCQRPALGFQHHQQVIGEVGSEVLDLPAQVQGTGYLESLGIYGSQHPGLGISQANPR
jgi:hypothetical protein